MKNQVLKLFQKKIEEYQIPEELSEEFDNDNSFKTAFKSLTPGRQKGYIIHYSSAKQSATRISRILKSKEAIFQGKGLNE